MARVKVSAFAIVGAGGTIYTIDGKVLTGVGVAIPLGDLADYARGSIIRGGAADWEAYDAKTTGAVLIGDGTDLVSTTTPTLGGTLTLASGAHVLPADAAGQDLGDATHRWDTFASYVNLPDGGWIGNSAATARLILDSSGVDYANFADCIVFINETANANMDIGLTIDQAAYDNEIVNLRSSDVGAVWNGVETNTFGVIRKVEGNSGGLHLRGLKDADGANCGAIRIQGYLAEAPDTTKSTAGRAIVETWGYQADGTNIVNTAANGNIWALRTRRGGADVTLAIVDEDGDTWLGGGMTLGLGTNQDYLFTNRGTASLAIQSRTPGTNSSIELFSADGDTTDYLHFNLYGLGTPTGIANRERLLMQWHVTDAVYNIFTEAGGTGTLRPLVLYTKGNANQLYLATDGKVGFNTTPDRRIHAREVSASTNVVIPAARFESEVSGGVGAVGHGAGVEFYGESSTTTNQAMGIAAFTWKTATHASRLSQFEVRTWYIGNEVLSGVVVAYTSASVDGNARGAGSVDWQNYRSAAAQVAGPGLCAVIGGGGENTASGDFTIVAGGMANTASGSTAAVSGGWSCLASGDFSWAAGYDAHATHNQSFVLSATNAQTVSWAANTFTTRCHGGARFYSAGGVVTGVELTAGANAWGGISARATKENFRSVADILDKIAFLPIYNYNLKSQSEHIRHIGPVAEDFNEIFGFTEAPLRINMSDFAGVGLAGLQALYTKVVGLRERVRELEVQLVD